MCTTTVYAQLSPKWKFLFHFDDPPDLKHCYPLSLWDKTLVCWKLLSSPRMLIWRQCVPALIHTNLSAARQLGWEQVCLKDTSMCFAKSRSGLQGWPAQKSPPRLIRSTSRTASRNPCTPKKSSWARCAESIHCLVNEQKGIRFECWLGLCPICVTSFAQLDSELDEDLAISCVFFLRVTQLQLQPRLVCPNCFNMFPPISCSLKYDQSVKSSA